MEGLDESILIGLDIVCEKTILMNKIWNKFTDQRICLNFVKRLLNRLMLSSLPHDMLKHSYKLILNYCQ